MIIKKRNRSGILCYWDDKQNASKIKSRKEKCEQIDLNSACKLMYPKEYSMMWHTVNESGAGGSAFYGGELNKRGRKKGVADWLVMVPCGGHHGLFLELKKTKKKGSEIRVEQKEFLLNAEIRGYATVVAYGYLSALEAIKDYLSNNIKHNT